MIFPLLQHGVFKPPAKTRDSRAGQSRKSHGLSILEDIAKSCGRNRNDIHGAVVDVVVVHVSSKSRLPLSEIPFNGVDDVVVSHRHTRPHLTCAQSR